MKLKRITLENFRGVRSQAYEFSDRTRIKGKNGSGKSTIASAYFWLMADRDYSLVSNPPVRTIGAIDEVVTTVTADLDFSGKPVQVQKMQKLKRSKSGAVALTNSYMVNSVPKYEKAFKEYLTDLGFDFDKFMPCSHPAVLLAGTNNKKERTALRNMLFEMASDLTDVDVAGTDPELAELFELLHDYNAEEIEAIQNNTLRIIREDYGKEGEILRAKIEGLETAKAEVDVEFHKSEANKLENQLIELEKKKYELVVSLEDINNAASELMEKKFRLNQMESDEIKDDIKKRSNLEADIMRLENQIVRLKDEIEQLHNLISYDHELWEDSKNKAAKNRSALKKIRAEEFDESAAVCPTCGQKLPADGVQKAINDFNARQEQRIRQFEEIIKEQEADTLSALDRMNKNTEEVKAKSKDLKAMETSLIEMQTIYESLGVVQKADMSGNTEYQKLLKEIAEAEYQVSKEEVVRASIAKLESQIREMRDDIFGHETEIRKYSQNNHIDEQIAKLRKDQKNYEQRRANADMILNQLKTLNMKKNKMMQESVNSHFNLINWQLFDFRKKGTPIDTCIPTIGGKKFGESMNAGLETMAKIDAINGIQKFFNLDYPILLDNAEHLDKWSLEMLQTDHQMIVLTVTDDEQLLLE